MNLLLHTSLKLLSRSSLSIVELQLFQVFEKYLYRFVLKNRLRPCLEQVHPSRCRMTVEMTVEMWLHELNKRYEQQYDRSVKVSIYEVARTAMQRVSSS